MRYLVWALMMVKGQLMIEHCYRLQWFTVFLAVVLPEFRMIWILNFHFWGLHKSHFDISDQLMQDKIFLATCTSCNLWVFSAWWDCMIYIWPYAALFKVKIAFFSLMSWIKCPSSHILYSAFTNKQKLCFLEIWSDNSHSNFAHNQMRLAPLLTT